MSAPLQTAAPTGRRKSAQGKSATPAANAALGHDFNKIPSPEGAKEGWKVLPLGDVLDINPRRGSEELRDDSLASFIPMKCVEEENGQFQPLGDRKVGEVRKGYTPFRDGDVIFAKVTPCMENGKAAVMKGLTNGIGFGSTEFFALRPKERLDASYLFHFILQSSFRRQAAQNMTGAVGLRRVPKSYLEQQPIPLPPLPEQQQIVAEIEKQFTRLEAGVAALRRVQANLKRYRAAVLQAACEGKLVPTEAGLRKEELRGKKDEGKRAKGGDCTSSFLPPPSSLFESGEQLLQRILAERRQHWETSGRKAKTGNRKYVEPSAPDLSAAASAQAGAANLPPLPSGWTWATLGQLLVYLRNGWGVKPDAEKGTPILRISANRPMSVNLADVRYLSGSTDDYAEYFVTEGDLLFTRYNGNPNLTGVCGVVPPVRKMIVHPDKLIRVRLVPKLCLPRFVGMVANVGVSRAFLAARSRTTAGQTGISGPDVPAIPIPLPPLAEQTRIVAEVERRLSVVEQLESVVSANLQRAVRLRQSILQKAFAGELV